MKMRTTSVAVDVVHLVEGTVHPAVIIDDREGCVLRLRTNPGVVGRFVVVTYGMYIATYPDGRHEAFATLADLLNHLEPAPSVAHPASSPDDLRALGLTVAVHNDYRLHGKPHTFWLFTDADDRAYQGEGLTDADALNIVRAKLASRKSTSAPRLSSTQMLFDRDTPAD